MLDFWVSGRIKKSRDQKRSRADGCSSLLHRLPNQRHQFAHVLALHSRDSGCKSAPHHNMKDNRPNARSCAISLIALYRVHLPNGRISVASRENCIPQATAPGLPSERRLILRAPQGLSCSVSQPGSPFQILLLRAFVFVSMPSIEMIYTSFSINSWFYPRIT